MLKIKKRDLAGSIKYKNKIYKHSLL